MAKEANNLNLTVVVSGQPVAIKANRHERVQLIADEALRLTNNRGQTDWELRTSDGILLNLEVRIDESGISDGATLYLSPRAGAGGSI